MSQNEMDVLKNLENIVYDCTYQVVNGDVDKAKEHFDRLASLAYEPSLVTSTPKTEEEIRFYENAVTVFANGVKNITEIMTTTVESYQNSSDPIEKKILNDVIQSATLAVYNIIQLGTKMTIPVEHLIEIPYAVGSDTIKDSFNIIQAHLYYSWNGESREIIYINEVINRDMMHSTGDDTIENAVKTTSSTILVMLNQLYDEALKPRKNMSHLQRKSMGKHLLKAMSCSQDVINR